ncbi:mediator of RNA polymerase II transcription subunit 14 [Tanacetum coccineum]
MTSTNSSTAILYQRVQGVATNLALSGITLQCGEYLAVWSTLVGETSGPVKLEETRHFCSQFCVPLIMDTVIRQIQALRIGRWKDAIRFELLSDSYQGQGSSAGSAADSMFFMHEGLQQARARIYDVPSAIEILLTGMYERLPKCTEDVGIHSTLTDKQQKPVLKKLDTLVTWNYLKLHYPNSSPRILHLEVLVGETSGPVKLEETRHFVLGDDLECRMAASDTPFTTFYTILHEFCVPLIMDTIIRQIQALRIGRWKDVIRFELISDGNQGQGSSASSVQTSQDGEADFVSLRTPGDKILYWLESEKNSRTLNAVSCPFIKIEPGSDLQIKCLNSSFVIDPLTNREAELSIDLELGENSHIRRAEGDVLLHTGLNEPGSEYNKICRVEDILVEGLIQGSVMHFHRAGTVTVPLTGIVSTSRMGCTGGVGRGHLLNKRIGSGGGYGGTAGHGCYNDTCIEGGLPYGDAELPCQLGSGGGNDSSAGGVIGSLEHPISSLFVDRSLTANGRSYVEGTASNLYDLYNSDGGGLGGGLAE